MRNTLLHFGLQVAEQGRLKGDFYRLYESDRWRALEDDLFRREVKTARLSCPFWESSQNSGELLPSSRRRHLYQSHRQTRAMCDLFRPQYPEVELPAQREATPKRLPTPALTELKIPAWAANLRNERAKKKMSRRALADAMKQRMKVVITPDGIQKHEEGKSYPRLENRTACAFWYEVDESSDLPDSNTS